MTARSRVLGLVAIVSAVAVAVVAVAVVAADDGSGTSAETESEPRAGRPPVSLALGFRADPEARDLRRASLLYEDGELHAAGVLFSRHDSLEAKVGLAFAGWAGGGALDRLEQLSKLYPESGVVQLHLGLARLWGGRGDPVAAWRAAGDAEPDSPYAVLAGSLLFPSLPRGLPAFVPSFAAPPSIVSLPAARQLNALRARAAGGDVRDLLLYGVGLQRVGRPVSAAEAFDRAARRARGDAEAQVAAAVGSFDKSRPEIAFGRLGPLTRTFPRDPTVRFHLGLLLLWTGRVDEAARQFRLASRTEPGSPLAREALRYLETIRKARS